MKGFYRHWLNRTGAFWMAAVFLSIPASVPAAAAPDTHTHDTVIWISMDGMRADYLDRAPLPFFHRMMSEGVFTRRSRPTFPSITFPSHCSQATGVGVDEHGISGNSFYDSATRQHYGYPDNAGILRAEPIWLTASRQGVRVAVHDWPLSQNEKGPVHAAYFLDKFDQAPTDEQRLAALLDTWRTDQTARLGTGTPGSETTAATTPPTPPLRLLMGYVIGTDSVGHKFGPDAPEIATEMIQLDHELGTFQEQALAQWKSTGATGHLYFLFTTDHGMSKVEKLVDLEKVLGLTHGQQEITFAFTGNTGSLFFDGIADAEQKRLKQEEVTAKLRELPAAQIYRREDLPAAWHYAHPTRVGDLVIVLAKGYTFSRLQPDPITDIAKAGSPKGMHGYPIGDDPEMFGPLILWRYPDALGGKELAGVDWSQIHPTVAKLLGIEPSPAAHGQPIDLP
jgi:hypothetical protein